MSCCKNLRTSCRKLTISGFVHPKMGPTGALGWSILTDRLGALPPTFSAFSAAFLSAVCVFRILRTQLPTNRAYKLRATPVSVVPLMIALPSGNRVIS